MSEPQVEGKTVQCRLLERRDVGDVGKLMEQFQHPIWGLTARSLYRVLCNDALARQHVLIVVTEEQGIAVRCRSRLFWAPHAARGAGDGIAADRRIGHNARTDNAKGRRTGRSR
ncbi:MAG TPA: hypothetical protein VM243_06465, partial [Phycisphaerae bacterium]|nr:hypothetical protein [Phycisphaerae bacterium]